jgi:polyisoprenoid-binding protein YceI
MAILQYIIRPTGESSVSIELHRNGLRKRKHVFFFGRYHGELEYDPEDLTNASAKIIVDASSMICRDAWLKPNEREAAMNTMAQMLEAEQYPQLTFASRSTASVSRHRADVTGSWNVRGASVNSNLDATIVPVGKDQLELDLRGTLRLSDHAIKSPNSFFGQPKFKDTAHLRLLLWPARGATAEQHRMVQASGRA